METFATCPNCGANRVRKFCTQCGSNVEALTPPDPLALACFKCGDVADPIGETDDRYRCRTCGRQFAGAKHWAARRVEAARLDVLRTHAAEERAEADAKKKRAEERSQTWKQWKQIGIGITVVAFCALVVWPVIATPLEIAAHVLTFVVEWLGAILLALFFVWFLWNLYGRDRSKN